MARGKRWTMTFVSLNNTICRVDIYDDGYTGDPVALEGADNPFSYSEIDDEDLLNGVIRYRTGYLRLIENSRGELDALRPSVNTDRYIEFYYGLTLDFNGFIQAQSFEEEWVGGRRVISLPVISPIGLAAGTKMPWTDSDVPGWRNIRGIMYWALTALNANYTGFVFPQYMETPSDPTLVATALYINTLVFVPWGNKYNKNGSLGDYTGIYEANSVEDALTVLCTGFGLILHDVPGSPIFQRMDYQGHYALFGLTGGATQITPAVTALPLLSTTVGADNTESVIMPLSKIEATYAGSRNVPAMTMDRCKGYSQGCSIPDKEFCTNMPNIADFVGTFEQYLSIDANGQITEGKVGLCAYGGGSLDEMILYRSQNGSAAWDSGYKLCSYTFYEWNGESVRLSFKHQYGNSIEEMDNPAANNHHNIIAVVVKTGSKYYNMTSGWQNIPSSLTYTKSWTDGRVECEVGIGAYYNAAPKPLVIEFYAASYNYPGWIQTISDVKLLNYQSASDAYLKENADPDTYTVNGSPSDIEGSITRGCSIMAMTMNRLRYDGSVINGTAWGEIVDLEPKYPYLIIKQERLSVGMKMIYQTPSTLYLNRLTVWGSSGSKWRVVARSFEPWNDTHRLTLHHSTVFDY